MPFWVGNVSTETEGEGGEPITESVKTYVTIPEKTVPVIAGANYTRILPLDLSAEIKDLESGEAPTADMLRAQAEAYIDKNNLSTPKVSLKVGFAQLEQSLEYKGIALLERVDLCDLVTVIFPALGVYAKAECIKVVYDVILDRVDSVELGDQPQNIADTIAENTVAASGVSGAANSAAEAAAIAQATAEAAQETANTASSQASAAAQQSASVVNTSGLYTVKTENGELVISDSQHDIKVKGLNVTLGGVTHPVDWVQVGSNYLIGYAP